MADSGIKPYPFMFSPDQWSNAFSPLQGKPIPWPAGFVGQPTDALGNPIQSYLDAQAAHDAWTPPPAPQVAPSTTLNSTPQASAGPGYYQTFPGSMQLGPQYAPPGASPGAQALYGRNFAAFMPPAGQPMRGQQPAAPAAAAPTNPVDMTAAYMAALAKPGRVTTPGATVPQSPPPSNQSGVLQQFLANWQNKGSPTTGAGNYDNAGFFNALRGQV